MLKDTGETILTDKRIRIGVQTKGLLEEDLSAEKKNEKRTRVKLTKRPFQMIRNAGFDCVDFNLDAFLKNNDVYAGKVGGFFEKSTQEILAYFEKYKQYLDECGLVCSQMHAPYPVEIEGKKKQNTFMKSEVIPKCFAVAQYLGIPYMVIHSSKLRDGKNGSVEGEIAANLDYYETLIPFIKTHGVKVCLENLYGGSSAGIIEGPCSDPYEALSYIETLNERAGEECFCFCLDSGHLNLVKRKFKDYTAVLGKHIRILHIHDNDGVGDIHQLPFTFRGTKGEGYGVDWDEYIEALRSIDFSGTLSFETYPVMSSFPEELHPAVLRTICETGEYLAQRITE